MEKTTDAPFTPCAGVDITGRIGKKENVSATGSARRVDETSSLKTKQGNASVKSPVGAQSGETLSQVELSKRSVSCDSSLSCIPETEVNTVATPGDNSGALLFNSFPVIEFCQQDLDDCSVRQESFDIDSWSSPSGVVSRQKKAALLLMELNLRRMLGRASAQEIEEAECSINKLLNEITPDLLQNSTYDLSCRKFANPLFLWPVTGQDYALLKTKRRYPEGTLEKIRNASGVMPQYGAVGSVLDEPYLNEFESQLLACYQLYHEFTVKSGGVTVDLMCIDVLEVYKDLMALRLVAKTDRQLSIQYQHLAFVWFDRLSEFFKMLSNDMIRLLEKSTNYLMPCNQSVSQKKTLRQEIDSVNKYLDKCFGLLVWAIDNGLHHLMDFNMLKELIPVAAHYLCVRIGLIIKYRNRLFQLANRLLHSVDNHDQKIIAYNEYVYLCEVMKSTRQINEILEPAFQCSVYLFVGEIIKYFGLFESSEYRSNTANSHSIYRAFDLLVEVRCRIKECEHVIKSIEDGLSMYDAYRLRKKNTGEKFAEKNSLLWLQVFRCALYYFLAGEKQTGSDLLASYGYGDEEKVFIYGLSLIAEGKYELAIQFMKKNVEINGREGYTVYPLLATLHFRLAMSFADDQEKRVKHYKMAASYLNNIVLVRKDFYAMLAAVQFGLADYSASIESLDHFCRYLGTFPLNSVERDQIFLIREQQACHRALMSAAKVEVKSAEKESEIKKTSDKRNKNKGKGKSKMASRRGEACQRQGVSVHRDTHPEPEKILKPTDSPDNSVSVTITQEMEKEQKTILTESSPSGYVCGEEKKLAICGYRDSLSTEDAEYAPWQTVKNKKKTECFQTGTEQLTELYVEQLMHSTRTVRLKLYTDLISYSRIDYKELLDRHNNLLSQHSHPVMQMLLIQNKVWTQRAYCFDLYALSQEAKRTGKSVSLLKMTLRKSAMDSLYDRIEKIGKLWSDSLPEGWKANPAAISESEEFRKYQRQVAKRFSVQFGAQFSTLAHIQQDIFHDQPPSEKERHEANRFYSKKPDEFEQLAKQYYKCRDNINPEHKSAV